MNEQSGDFESQRDGSVPGIPGAPLISLENSAFWRWIAQARPDCGHGGGGLRGVRVLPRGDTWPHVVEMPIRMGFVIPCIDNAAHEDGLVAGAL